MATTTKILKLDVASEQSYIYLKCKQYDSQSRIYKLIITDRHEPISLKGTELVVAHMIKSDGKYADGIVEWKDDGLYLTITDAMLSVAGDATLEVKISSTGMPFISFL